jgi:hypothetical protein
MDNNMNQTETPPAKTGNGWKITAIILIAVIVAGLAAGLTWWLMSGSDKDKKNDNSSNTSQTDDDQTSSDMLVADLTSPLDNPKMTVEHPRDWVASRNVDEQDENITFASTEITSPSGEYVISFGFNNMGGVGGACDPSEAGFIVQLNRTPTANSNYELLEIINTTFSGTYYPMVVLVEKGTYDDATAGDSECDTFFAGFSSNGQFGQDARYFNVSTDFSVLQDEFGSQSADTLGEVQSAMSGQEYQQVRSILLSLTEE